MDFDCVLVGGGLQNALIALAILAQRPQARIAIVESEPRLGGNHLWSFHAADVPEDARAWVEPLVVARWPRWEVRFPGLTRTIDAGYSSIASARLHEIVGGALARPGCALFTGSAAHVVEADHVILESGRRLAAPIVIDARGPRVTGEGDDSAYAQSCGWQKFLGVELAIRGPSIAHPIVMDATVPQTDGFRFLYVLPLAHDRVLVEDTYFADGPALDVPALRAGILDAARGYGLDVVGIVREEVGRLPLPTTGVFDHPPHGPLRAGFGGGWFHPTTGYSLPCAVRVARHVAASTAADLYGPAFRSLVDRHARQVRFAQLLNRLLFEATAPSHRRDVLERFHRLPEATIGRFYALETTAGDRARIVCGRPPKGVSLRAALARMVTA
jgi:lycopene beta-cyclase